MAFELIITKHAVDQARGRGLKVDKYKLKRMIEKALPTARFIRRNANGKVFGVEEVVWAQVRKGNKMYITTCHGCELRFWFSHYIYWAAVDAWKEGGAA